MPVGTSAHHRHFKQRRLNIFGHVCVRRKIWIRVRQGVLKLCFMSTFLTVIPLTRIHNSAASLCCWLPLLALRLSLNLSKGLKNEIKPGQMPKRIPPRIRWHPKSLFCSRRTVFNACQSPAADWQDKMCSSTSMQDYMLLGTRGGKKH